MSTEHFENLMREPGFQALFKAARHRSYPKHHVILAEASTPGCLYLLVSGLVSVRHTDSHGSELLLAYLYPGDFFGEMCLFPDVSTRCAMVKTCGPCMALEIGYQAFLDLTQQHTRLWLELAGQLASRLRATNRRLAQMPVLHAADRVWMALQEIATNSDGPSSPEGKIVHITRQDLGKLACCSRELTGMILKDFAAAGRITVHGKNIVIHKSVAEPLPRIEPKYPTALTAQL